MQDRGLIYYSEALSMEDQTEIFELVKPQIESQSFNPFLSYIMANMGYMWAPHNLYVYSKLLPKEWRLKNNPINDVKKINKRAQYFYYTTDQHGNSLPKIPTRLLELVGDRIGLDMQDYDALLINIYPPNRTLNAHIDHTEDITAEGYPIVSVSLGDSGIFSYSHEPYRAIDYTPDMRKLKDLTDLKLNSGDIVIFGEESRLIQHRAVVPDTIEECWLPKLKLGPDSKPKTLSKYRLNLTFRRAAPISKPTPNVKERIEKTTGSKKIFKKLF
jgi:alkylated DNA repair dioxygenase AlkB